MPIDFTAVRRAYFEGPGDGPPDHIPTREERIGWAERRAVESYRRGGWDPEAAGIGEHGSLIGGPSKPLRVDHREFPPEDVVPIRPVPLEWFSYPEAMRSCLAPELTPAPARGHPFLDHMLKAHAAGMAPKPTPAELARIIGAETVTDHEHFHLRNMFGCVYAHDFARFLWDEGLSIFELARAIHHSRVRRNHLIRWLHQFALNPADIGPGCGMPREGSNLKTMSKAGR